MTIKQIDNLINNYVKELDNYLEPDNIDKYTQISENIKKLLKIKLSTL